jgi:hypothetical protein
MSTRVRLLGFAIIIARFGAQPAEEVRPDLEQEFAAVVADSRRILEDGFGHDGDELTGPVVLLNVDQASKYLSRVMRFKNVE